jgi:2-polyprenyl-3-methyl-5-hydroxy-6-metoxy-1,4-benzoquinol methylase
MQVLDNTTKFAHLGKPGESFSKGFDRRLEMMKDFVDFKDKKVLDLGCGKGVWLDRFSELTGVDNVYGEDVDTES